MFEPVAAIDATAVMVAVPVVEFWPAGKMPVPRLALPEVAAEPPATRFASAERLAAPVVWATPLTMSEKLAAPLVELDPVGTRLAAAAIVALPEVLVDPSAESGKATDVATLPLVAAEPVATTGKTAVSKRVDPEVEVWPLL